MSSHAVPSRIPLIYRIFFLYIEPISALGGAYYAAFEPKAYLADLLPFHPPSPASGNDGAVTTASSMVLTQLANLYLLFALNEHFVLSSTSDIWTWKRLLFGLLVADIGHLISMYPAGWRAFNVFWCVPLHYA